MERKIEEKFLWINSANMLSDTTTNFYYNIGNILYVDNYKKLSIQLIDCIISKNYQIFVIGNTTYFINGANPFYTTIIKVYVDFGVASNLLNNNYYGLLMGIINNNNVKPRLGTTTALNYYYYPGLGSAKLEIDNKIK